MKAKWTENIYEMKAAVTAKGLFGTHALYENAMNRRQIYLSFVNILSSRGQIKYLF